MSNTNTAAAPSATDFEYVNLADVDDSRKAMDENVYTFEINKLECKDRVIQKPDSPMFGQSVLFLNGSYTIVDDPKYSGRKIWQNFMTTNKVALIQLKKQMQATGVLQQEGESLRDYAAQFATMNPPARFQAPLKKIPDWKDPTGEPVNEIVLQQAKPAS